MIDIGTGFCSVSASSIQYNPLTHSQKKNIQNIINMPLKTIFITGAASGIGAATARKFHAQGWFVGLYDLNPAPLAELQRSLGTENSCFMALDVRDREAVAAAMDHFGAHSGGRMNLLFNCAGIIGIGPFEDLRLEDHLRTAEVNFQGVLNCTFLAFPLLKATPGARVVSMSSASARYGTPDFASYSASKFAVRGLTEALNIEWRRHGIVVSDIMPPFVNTPMIQNGPASKSFERMGIRLRPEQVAEVVWKAARGNKVHYPVGLQFKLLNALSAVSPDWLTRRVMRWIGGY